MGNLFKNKYRIESIRLKHWDYSSCGYYFVTICTKNRECIFGEILNGKMVLNEIGEIIKLYWVEIAKYFQNIDLDEFVVMPNHFHGIIIITGDFRPCRDGVTPSLQNSLHNNVHNAPQKQRQPTLGQIIGYFKYQTTKIINKRFRTPGSPIWQPRFYEHIIRNKNELNRIQEYIINNPIKWEFDRNNTNIKS